MGDGGTKNARGFGQLKKSLALNDRDDDDDDDDNAGPFKCVPLAASSFPFSPISENRTFVSKSWGLCGA